MTLQEAENEYREAQGRYASELQRFSYSARPNVVALLSAGAAETAARKTMMELRRQTNDK